jgi:hypothetical protein
LNFDKLYCPFGEIAGKREYYPGPGTILFDFYEVSSGLILIEYLISLSVDF